MIRNQTIDYGYMRNILKGIRPPNTERLLSVMKKRA